MAVQKFTDLNAWQESHNLALNIYRITDLFPKKETFGLSSQMQRCAVSVSSNIAEGFNRFSKKEKAQFYSIALGSVSELQSQLLLAKDLNYASQEDCNQLLGDIETVRKLITGLSKSSKHQ
ncbi:four helix bundle protein [Candidatus Saccharibacteria bacterium QS_5_54_17]|nr:MAG: four helix bundle protein [Candidatus Saccharibacteria bacterium QS_5_54_17]